MVDIQPFVATRFSPNYTEQLGDLLTPPYDVIDPKMQEAFYAAHPNNLVRVDFGKDLPGDDQFSNRYTRSEANWNQWKSEGVLVEDPKKSFYIYEQTYQLPTGKSIARRGFFAAVRLQDFSEGGIRAHEHTFDGPKADRYRLMRATHSNLSPIFCLFDDAERHVDELIEEAVAGLHPIETSFNDNTLRLWNVSKRTHVKGLIEALKSQMLFIADGHHRYETGLLYRDKMRAALDRHNGCEPFDYTMMYLNNIHDPGLVVLPTHRILSKEACLGVDADDSLDDLRESFEVEPLDLNPDDLETEARRFTERLEEVGRATPSFILLLPKGRAYLLRLKAEADMDELIDDDTPSPIKQLDVTILHDYIINRMWMGNPEIELDDQDVFYIKDAAEVLRRMMRCKYGMGFLLNATRIEQVCQVAREGLRMPHKSTYFYPKLVTGLVMRDLNSPW